MAFSLAQQTSRKIPIRRSSPQRFRRGDRVEVASSQEGFVGSYYEGTVVDYPTKSDYVIQYKTLVTEDLSRPLRELVPATEVRPRPPVIAVADEYQLHDLVDAFDNDGWWVGKITGRTAEGKYYVFFATTGDEIAYSKDRLRIHQDWVRGKWVYVS